MAPVWFRAMGPSYRPASWQGVALVLAAVVCCVAVFIVVDRRSHSVSDTLYGVLPYITVVALLLHGVASRTSGGSA